MIIWRVSTVGFLALMALSHSAASDSHYGNPIAVDQGWSDADRAFFYFAPQGSPILPLDYFLALEQPASEALFSDRAFLKSLGMIYWDDAD